MKVELVKTADGSSSLYVPELDEHYHSSHGAIQEARHVFIENGIRLIDSPKIRVFELGFGTGLNALLTMDYAVSSGVTVDYTGIEAYPVALEMVQQLNYLSHLERDFKTAFYQMHAEPWDKRVLIEPCFNFTKIHKRIEDYDPEESSFDLVYFDAFGFRAQSELWEKSILEKMAYILVEEGRLVTYAARGQFKRDLRSLGFEVLSLPGPPGKREMTVAIKK
jgi:tRNA U34 5-methylaminomethyl-2-thiouridine-forming methyltransferase MnmC